MPDYLEALKKTEEWVDDDTPWNEKFRAVCAMGIEEQAEVFSLRFALQFTMQDLEAKDVVKKVQAVADMFKEKTKGTEGKSLKYAGVEFGAVLNEFVPGMEMTFVERKKQFNPFDLDGNGYVDVIEFLLYLYKPQILSGYRQRHGVESVENEAEALMMELVNVPVFVDTKLDENILGLANLKKEHEETMQKLKDEATEGPGVKKIQLANNLKNEETKYEEAKKGFWPENQINKKKLAMQKQQAKLLSDTKGLLAKEDADAAAPKGNLKKQ